MRAGRYLQASVAGVRFASRTKVYKHTVHHPMTPTPIRIPKPNYQHDPALANLTIATAETNARLEAEQLASDVVYDSHSFWLDCAATFMAPRKWLLDTGAPHDITSVNSVGQKNHCEAD